MNSPTTTPVTGVDFVNVPTTDLDRARKFYGEVLGLEASSVYQRGDSPPMGAEFETGTVTLALIDSAAIGREFRANSLPIALRVEDVEAARTALEAQGVSFGADTLDTGVCHMAFFEDPDGNALMLHRRYAPRN
jgi:catechol 2,3-dioxygenase-like lactoylglutathione lyase family enzyme